MSDKTVDLGLPATGLHARLVEAFRADDVAVGDTVPGELQLAARLGVSRPHVREGLRALEALGAITSGQGARRVWRGFDLTTFGRHLALTLEPDPRSIAELLEIRQILEASLLPRALDTLGPDDLLELRHLADEMTGLAAAGKAFVQQDRRFHTTLFKSLGNQTFLGMLDAFWSLLSAAPPADPADGELAIAQSHGAILDAIEAADTGLAIHRLDAHFYGIRSRLPAVKNAGAERPNLPLS